MTLPCRLLLFSPLLLCQAKYTLGLLHLQRGDRPAALECAAFASEVYAKHLGPEHPSTRDVMSVLQDLNRDPST
jgi:hypothetical protein